MESVDLADLVMRVKVQRTALLDHFDAEEALLLPRIQLEDGELAARLRREHLALRQYLDVIDAGDVTPLAAFAELLIAHVRFEERELFPSFEAWLESDVRRL